jgi:hypothetical protein
MSEPIAESENGLDLAVELGSAIGQHSGGKINREMVPEESRAARRLEGFCLTFLIDDVLGTGSGRTTAERGLDGNAEREIVLGNKR